MKSKIKSYIRRLIFGYDLQTYFFSQCGEDAILQAIFRNKLEKGNGGVYVDVGAYHPYNASNTYLFYLNGWRGINIDARPGSMKDFEKIRPKDINLEIGIGTKEEELTYYFISENSSMNSFSKDYLVEIDVFDRVKKEIPCKVKPLKTVLEDYQDQFNHIDFLNIDVEGYDMEVIKSNDWTRFRPSVVIVELNCRTVADLASNETAQFMMDVGYEIVAKNVVLPHVASVFFVDKNFDYSLK